MRTRVSTFHMNEKSGFISRRASVWKLKICIISSRWRTSFLAIPNFSTATQTSSSEWPGLLKCCATGKQASHFPCVERWVGVDWNASCLPDENCPGTFTARNAINDVIWSALEMHCGLNRSFWWWNWSWLANVSTGTADGSLAGEGAWLLCWLSRRNGRYGLTDASRFWPVCNPSTAVVKKGLW